MHWMLIKTYFIDWKSKHKKKSMAFHRFYQNKKNNNFFFSFCTNYSFCLTDFFNIKFNLPLLYVIRFGLKFHCSKYWEYHRDGDTFCCLKEFSLSDCEIGPVAVSLYIQWLWKIEWNLAGFLINNSLTHI